MDLVTQFPDDVSFRGMIMDLPADVLMPVVEQLCGGAGVSDITLWKHACRLAQTCQGFWNVVLNSPILRGVEFRGELVGKDAPEDDDPTKESILRVDRPRFKPHVTLILQYGNKAYGACGSNGTEFTESMLTWTHPLDVHEVLETFHHPPGWKRAAKLTLSGKEAPPWTGCFPVDKLPESGKAMATVFRLDGSENSSLKFHRKTKHLSTGQATSLDVTFNDADVHPRQVVAMCSTGIEEFKRGERAHYLEDLEIGVPTSVPPCVINNIDVRCALSIDPHEPPDLYYRFKPEEARRLAGYDIDDRQGIYDLIHPPRKPSSSNPDKRRWQRLYHMDSEEEWDPDARKRQKAEARERTRQQLDVLGQREDRDEDDDSYLPSSKSKGKQKMSPSPPVPIGTKRERKQSFKKVFQETQLNVEKRVAKGACPVTVAKYGLAAVWQERIDRFWKAILLDERYSKKEWSTQRRYCQATCEAVRFLRRFPCAKVPKLGVVDGSSPATTEALVLSHKAAWKAHCIAKQPMYGGQSQTLAQWYANIEKLQELVGAADRDDDSDMEWEEDHEAFMPHNEGAGAASSSEADSSEQEEESDHEFSESDGE